MELVLDQNIAERGIYPAVSILESERGKKKNSWAKIHPWLPPSTRKLADYRDVEALAEILGAFRRTQSNRELFDRIAGKSSKIDSLWALPSKFSLYAWETSADLSRRKCDPLGPEGWFIPEASNVIPPGRSATTLTKSQTVA